MKKIYFYLLLMCIQVSVFAQRVINLNDDNAASLKTTAAIPQQYLKEAKSVRTFVINPVLQGSADVSVGDIVNLQLLNGQSYTSTITNITTDVNGTLTLSLKLPEYPMAHAFIITGKEEKSLVSVSIPELDKTVVSRSNIYTDASYLMEVDKKQMAVQCEEVEIPKENNEELKITEEGSENKKKIPELRSTMADNCAPTAGPTDPARIDILMLYTPAAKAWADANEGSIANTLAATMAKTKAVIDNQGNGDAINLVHSQQITYTEYAQNEMNTDLSRLTETNDGYLDEVHELRKQYNADIVVLVGRYDNPGGLGWVLNNENGSYGYGFNVVRVQQIGWTTTSIHEIGHNMGMRHNVEDNSGSGLYPYAFGWHWTGTDNQIYGSVMSYIGTETPYFSNPSISYMGQPTGTATANNAQVFRNTKHAVAFYSNKLTNLPSAPTNIVASSPTAGGATISWDAADNAVKYKVCVFVSGSSGSYYPFETTSTSLTFNYTGNFASCTTYSFFVQALNDCDDAVNSSILTFTTKCATDPTVTTLAATNITNNSAILNKQIDNDQLVTEQGFKYKEASSSTWLTSADGNLTGLTTGTQYQFYAYAQTASSIFNGSVLTFTTSACDAANQIVYTIEMKDAYGDGWNNASLLIKQNGVDIQTATLSSGATESSNITLCPCMPLELVWKKGSYDYECSFVIKGNSGETVFETPAGSGSTSETAGCAAYANNQAIFTGTTVCIIATQSATNVTPTSALLNKNITAGSETILEEGFYYKKSSENSWILSTNGSLTGLSPNTEYEFYAYVITGSGTINGSILTFTTGVATSIDIVNANNIVIYPNPAKDVLRIMNYEFEEGDMLQITDISGKAITNYELQIVDDKEIQINISALPQGIYLLKIKNFTGRFIKTGI